MVPLQAHAQSLLGDVNDDGQVNISDVTPLINYLLTDDATSVNLLNADMNTDGSVTISDVTSLIEFILRGGEQPQTETFVIDEVSFTMVFVKGGTFTMGTNAYPLSLWSGPAHEVTLSDFCIGQTEVTQALWVAVMGTNPSWFCSTEGFADDFQRPVEEVSWWNCQDFITKLNRLTGRHFRLPTEAEWEYAARGGNKSQGYLFAGSDDINEVGWWYNNTPSMENGEEGYGTRPVGMQKPNELGLYDMTGNVAELVYDWYANYSDEEQVDPMGPETGQSHVHRGGSWHQDELNSTVFSRFYGPPYGIAIDLGFRLVLAL